MQYLNLILLQLNIVLASAGLSALLCYVLFGSSFLELIARLLKGRNDDDDDDSGDGGILQPALVPVRVHN
mgnify:CR=1 FL=1